MDAADEIESRLSGDAVETKRRVDIWCAEVEAFRDGGEDAAAAVLREHMNSLKLRFDKAMKQLDEKL